MSECNAFVIEVSHNGDTNTYFVSVDLAFSIARCSKNLVLVCIGNKRYRFVNGEPLLSIVKDNYSNDNALISI